MLTKYICTAQMSWRSKTNGGLLSLIPNVLLQILYLVPLMFLWRVVLLANPDAGMSVAQMMTYTYLSALLSEQLTVRTALSSWLYEGTMLTLYERPMPLFGQLAAQTAGGWVPMLLLFSLPMALVAPVLGISLIPATLWFVPSLILCISLGFAIDLLFACLTIRLSNMSWLVYSIRMAVVSLFSGAVIPFSLLPFGWGAVLSFQPFGSLGGAPLSLMVGSAEPLRIITTQVFWNLILWPMAVFGFRKSQERMMSYGG